MMAKAFILIAFLVQPYPALRAEEAAEIFIGFAKEHLGNRYADSVPHHWETDIAFYARTWTPGDAQRFLEFMVERTTVDNTINVLFRLETGQADKFANMDFDSFVARVAIHEEYIGREGVGRRLSMGAIALMGFDEGDVGQMRGVAGLWENVAGREALAEELMQNPRAIVNVRLRDFESLVRLLRNSVGNIARQEDIDDLITEAMEIVRYLSGLIGMEDSVRVLSRHPEKLAAAKASDFKTTVEFVRGDYVAQEGLKEFIDKYIGSLLEADGEELKRVVALVEEYVGIGNAEYLGGVRGIVAADFGLLTDVTSDELKPVLDIFRDGPGRDFVATTIEKGYFREIVFIARNRFLNTLLTLFKTINKVDRVIRTGAANSHLIKKQENLFERIKLAETYVKAQGVSEMFLSNPMWFLNDDTGELKEWIPIVENRFGTKRVAQMIQGFAKASDFEELIRTAGNQGVLRVNSRICSKAVGFLTIPKL